MTSHHTTTLLKGRVGEIGPLYTRLLATDSQGPNVGAILLTAEVYRDLDDGLPAFPIYRSLDGGVSWELLAQVRDVGLGLGHRHQPTLYELPQAFAGLDRGTLLISGNAIPDDMSSTHLVLYASDDGGATWRYLSTIDEGGPARYDPNDGSSSTAVWEPDLRLLGGRLVCFFADERRKADGMHQVISMRSTRDLVNWSQPSLVKGIADGKSRPGMFVTTDRMPNGRFGAVMEIVGEPGTPVSWMTSDDGLHWGDPADLGERITTGDGLMLSATPNVHWRLEPTGTITVIVTGRTALANGRVVNSALMNADGGRGPWRELPLPVAAVRLPAGDDSGYSQSVVWNVRDELVQATTVRNERGSNDIVVATGAAPSGAAPASTH